MSVYNAAVDLVDRNVREGRGTKLAFADPARRITYAELAEDVARVGPMLARLGLQREDRFAMIMQDTVEFPVLFFGAIRAGIIPIPLNTLLPVEQFRYILQELARQGAVRVAAESRSGRGGECRAFDVEVTDRGRRGAAASPKFRQAAAC